MSKHEAAEMNPQKIASKAFLSGFIRGGIGGSLLFGAVAAIAGAIFPIAGFGMLASAGLAAVGGIVAGGLLGGLAGGYAMKGRVIGQMEGYQMAHAEAAMMEQISQAQGKGLEVPEQDLAQARGKEKPAVGKHTAAYLAEEASAHIQR